MGITDIYQNLKMQIAGTKTTSIDQKLDQAVTDITNYKSQSGRNGYIDLVRSLISKTASGIDIDTNKGIFSQGASPATFGQAVRLTRYKSFEGTATLINYCYRALEVLTDNIISPDDITKTALEVKPKKFLEDETPTEAKTKEVKSVIKSIKLEENLNIIVKQTLMMGDFFCEIADAKTALSSKAYLAEDYLLNESIDLAEGRKEIITSGEYQINIDYTHYLEAKMGGSDIKKVHLVFHDPARVVKLQSELYPLCFGYLAFPKMTMLPGVTVADHAINDICGSIVKNLEKKIPQMKEFNTKELKDIIATLVDSSKTTSKVLNIRYVPPDKMQHFMRPTIKYYPYGESIFDSCQFTAKCLIAMETALTVQRIARSTEKRKIAVEIGLPRDAKKMIEKLKEEFRKRKISLDSYGSIDTIPSMISTFEDVYIPQKDGKPFVDISTFTEGNVDVRQKVDELKFLRDSVVASLGVPPAFISIEENLSNKAALSEENILFARTIIGHQKYLTHQINELIQKVFDIIKPDAALSILDNVTIAFPTPKSLQFEREARYMSELANLVETLERIGIPKEYSKKKYLTGIDWKELRNFEIDGKIGKELGTSEEEEDQLGGGGIGGMGGGY
jgi:hypothetical protein